MLPTTLMIAATKTITAVAKAIIVTQEFPVIDINYKQPNKYSSADVRDKPGCGGKIPHMPKLLDQVREVLRMKHYSLRTEQAYVNWIKRYIFFHDKRHPAEMGEVEIRTFISDLASKKSVAASTQTVALSALLFLYRDVLKKEQPFIEGIERNEL